MKLQFIIVLVAISLVTESQTVKIPTDSFDSSSTKQRVYYINEKTGKYYGCGRNLEGLPGNIMFARITLNKSTRTFYLMGYCYMDIDAEKRDTIGFNNVEIFTATPSGEHLRNKKVILNNHKKSNIKNVWKEKTGFFEITFRCSPSDYLYFEFGNPYCMTEYNLKKYKWISALAEKNALLSILVNPPRETLYVCQSFGEAPMPNTIEKKGEETTSGSQYQQNDYQTADISFLI